MKAKTDFETKFYKDNLGRILFYHTFSELEKLSPYLATYYFGHEDAAGSGEPFCSVLVGTLHATVCPSNSLTKVVEAVVSITTRFRDCPSLTSSFDAKFHSDVYTPLVDGSMPSPRAIRHKPLGSLQIILSVVSGSAEVIWILLFTNTIYLTDARYCTAQGRGSVRPFVAF